MRPGSYEEGKQFKSGVGGPRLNGSPEQHCVELEAGIGILRGTVQGSGFAEARLEKEGTATGRSAQVLLI